MVVIEIWFHHMSNPMQDMDIKDLIAKLSDLSVSETFVTPSVPIGVHTCFKWIFGSTIVAEAALQSWTLRLETHHLTLVGTK